MSLWLLSHTVACVCACACSKAAEVPGKRKEPGGFTRRRLQRKTSVEVKAANARPKSKKRDLGRLKKQAFLKTEKQTL